MKKYWLLCGCLIFFGSVVTKVAYAHSHTYHKSKMSLTSSTPQNCTCSCVTVDKHCGKSVYFPARRGGYWMCKRCD